MRTPLVALVTLLVLPLAAVANPILQTKGKFQDKFRQLETEAWPTPTDYRNAAGEPGYRYWQQTVDYKIKASLDENAKVLTGSASVSYRNNSPDSLRYLWLQLDQNIHRRNSISALSRTVTTCLRL